MMDKAARMTARMAIPPGSLGLLEKQVQKLFRAWPEFYETIKPYHYIFAADNGVVTAGVVRQEQAITYLQARNMTEGRAAISCFCRAQDVPYAVVDVGINCDEAVGLDRKVAPGTKNFLESPAMTEREFWQAYDAGAEMVQRAKLAGCNLLSFGEMGIGNTTTSTAVLHVLTGANLLEITGYGANPGHPEVVLRKREVIAAAVKRYEPLMKAPQGIIRCVGGFDIAALCGAMMACHERKIPFMLDGFITAVALACAARIEPAVSAMAIPSHMSQEPGMLYALQAAGIHPDEVPIQAGLRLGEGTGAILGLSMLRTMLYTVYNMKTMEELLSESCGAAK